MRPQKRPFCFMLGLGLSLFHFFSWPSYPPPGSILRRVCCPIRRRLWPIVPAASCRMAVAENKKDKALRRWLCRVRKPWRVEAALSPHRRSYFWNATELSDHIGRKMPSAKTKTSPPRKNSKKGSIWEAIVLRSYSTCSW